MSEWNTLTTLFDAMRSMAAEMIETLPAEEFDQPRGGSNSPKWITGHLALGMDFGLSLLGRPTEAIPQMMPAYGPGSPGGAIGDDGRTQASLLEHFRTVGDQLREALPAATAEQLTQPNPTPFLTQELPATGDLLAHLISTHLALHLGQLSQIRRELGLESYYTFT